MKPIDAQDHYEILEVSTRAGQEELDRAYRIGRSAFARGALASYSVFDEVDASVIREKVELAYSVLSDPAQRRVYDESIGREGGAAEGAFLNGVDSRAAEDVRRAELPASLDAFDDLEAEEEEERAGFDGARLRRARLRRGIDLDDMAVVTKISSTYLECLEEGRFDLLPARVYVRGFVDAYARMLGLDCDRVTRTYMSYFDNAGDAPRKRLSGPG
jgi:flagellar biosynthesis protein FlhG